MANLFVSQGRCQFCHQTSQHVEHIIAGDSGLICGDCVQRCAALLAGGPSAVERPAQAERHVFQRLVRHCAPLQPHEMLVTSREFPQRQHADLQGALDELLGERRVPEDFVGLRQQYAHESMGFSKLLQQDHGPVEIAPAQFEDVDIGDDDSVRCLKNGLWLLHEQGQACAVVLAERSEYGNGHSLTLDVAVAPGEIGAAFTSRLFDAIERRLSTGSCYRGRVLSLEPGYQWSGQAAPIASTRSTGWRGTK